MKSKSFLSTLLILAGLLQAAFAFEHEEVVEEGLIGDFYHTPGLKNQRPIIIFGGSGGGNYLRWNNRDQYILKDLENKGLEGYAIMALSYFDYDSVGELPTTLKDIPLEYFKTAMDWLANQPGIQRNDVAIYGTSRGAELALLLSAHYPEIKAVIAAVPSAYVWGSYHRNTSTREAEIRNTPCGSAWTYRGKGIPSICNDKLALFDPWHAIVDDLPSVEYAVIPVEKMSAAVLLLSGKYDDVWPSTEMSNRVIERLGNFHYPYPYRHITYSAGHDVFTTSWNDIVSFLKEHYPVQAEEQF